MIETGVAIGAVAGVAGTVSVLAEAVKALMGVLLITLLFSLVILIIIFPLAFWLRQATQKAIPGGIEKKTCKECGEEYDVIIEPVSEQDARRIRRSGSLKFGISTSVFILAACLLIVVLVEQKFKEPKFVECGITARAFVSDGSEVNHRLPRANFQIRRAGQ